MHKIVNKLLPFSLLAFLTLGFFVSSFGADEGGPQETHNTQTPVLISSDSILVPRDISSYSKEAASIVIGEVKEVRATTNAYRSEAILKITDVLKGTPSDSMTVLLDAQGLEDAPMLIKGEKVLLFLAWNTEAQKFTIYAGDNGKYLINPDDSVIGAGDFKVKLSDFEIQISSALSN